MTQLFHDDCSNLTGWGTSKNQGSPVVSTNGAYFYISDWGPNGIYGTDVYLYKDISSYLSGVNLTNGGMLEYITKITYDFSGTSVESDLTFCVSRENYNFGIHSAMRSSYHSSVMTNENFTMNDVRYNISGVSTSFNGYLKITVIYQSGQYLFGFYRSTDGINWGSNLNNRPTVGNAWGNGLLYYDFNRSYFGNPYTTGRIEDVVVNFIPSLPTMSVYNHSASSTTASITCELVTTGGESCTKRGVCYATASTPTIADSKVEETGTYTTGYYSENLAGLSAGTLYYARAYAYNSSGYGYSDNYSFNTLTTVSLTTQAVSSVYNTSGVGNYTLVSLGYDTGTITHGVCYMQGIAGTPTTANSTAGYSNVPSTTGAKTVNITGLTRNTSYRVRGFAINSIGVSYGSTVDMTTLNVGSLTVTLSKPVAYTSSGVNVTGNITSIGGVSATVRGVCYATGGTATVPTIANSTAGEAGNFGTGSFNYTITGVATGSQYHVRSFAINTEGVGYSSDQVHFDIETQSSSIGLLSLTPNKKVGIKKETSIGINAPDPIKQRGTWKVLTLFSGYSPFPYSFSFLFSSDSDGYPLGLTSLKDPVKLTKWMSSKIGLYVDPLSMWEYVFNGVKLIIRVLSTSMGMGLPRDTTLLHFERLLDTTVGLVSSYFKNLSFNRQISLLKIGALATDVIKNAGIKINLLAQAGMYTKGLWSKYNYSKTVVVNPSTDGALSSYPMKLTIHRTTGTDTTSDVYVGTDCSFDYTDIDFTTTDGVYLEHWIESYTGTEAVVWVKVTNIPASPTTTNIIFYYGSTLGSAHNSGENTFTFFDDFSAGLSKWTSTSGVAITGEELIVQSTSTATNTAYSNTSFGTNYALRARLKSAHSSGNYIEDASISSTDIGLGVGASYCSYYSVYNQHYYNNNSEGRDYESYLILGWSANTYHIQDMIRNGVTNTKFYVDNSNGVTTTSANLDIASHPIRFFTVNNTAKLTIDWVLIRPYTTNEPSFSTWGSKITTAGSPFKEYILKGYRGLSTNVGLLSTKYKGIGYKFGILKIGLVSAVSQAVQSIRDLSSKLGIKSSIGYAIALLRSLNTAVGFAFSKSAGLVQILATSFGLVAAEAQAFASYKFIASIGLASSYIVNKGAVILLSTSLGIKSSILKTGLSLQDLTMQLGLRATRGNNVLSRVFNSSIGIMTESTSVLKAYFSFISSLDLVSDMVRQYSVFKDLSIKTGLFAAEGIRNVGIEIRVYIGLIAGHVKKLSYIFSTAIGMLSILSRQISVFIILQKAIGLSLIRETRAYFEEVLSASFGMMVSDLWYKSGGRVREFTTSLGLSSFVSNTEGFYRELYHNVGLVATKLYNIVIIKDISTSIGFVSLVWVNTMINIALDIVIGIKSRLSINVVSFRDLSAGVGMYASKQVLVGVSFITMIGLMAVKGTIRWAGSLFTYVGFIAFVDRHRHDLETLSTSIGLVARSTSKWFGQKRFKTLKFLNPATKDNKKLRVQK